MTTEKKPMRVAGVARVSSKKQEKEASLETQKADIAKSCTALGFGEPRWYVFVEKATKRGLDPAERKEFERLLRDAVTNEYDLVMVHHPSRWCRNQEDGARALRIFNGCTPRKEFYVLGERKHIHTAAGRQAMGFATVQAEGESDYLRERMMINKFAAADKDRRWPCRMPWGLRQEKHTLQWSQVPGTQAVVDRIYDLIVRQGYSMEDMAKKLGQVIRKKNKKGQWIDVTKPSAQVWRQRMAQFGVPFLTLTNYETNERKTFTFPKAPERLSEAQMAQIKKRWDANSTMGKPVTGKRGGGKEQKRARYEEYPLTGKLKCSGGKIGIDKKSGELECACGTTITGVTTRGRNREYRHGNAMIKSGGKCCNAVPADAIEKDVFPQLRLLMLRHDLPELILKGQQQAVGRVDFDALIERQRKELERIQQDRADLVRLKAKMKDIDADTLRTFGDELSKLSTDQTAVEAKLAELEQDRAELRQRKTRAQETADLLRYIAEDPRRWNRNNQRILLDAFFGIGNLKGKEPGIYVTKKVKPNGRCDYIPAFRFAVDFDQAIQLMAGQMKPGELGRRPYLLSKKEPNVIINTSI